MDLKQFQQRVIRRVTSPVQLIYAITSHWFLVLLFLVIGTFIMFMQVSNEPPLYSSKSTLILAPPEHIVPQSFGRVQGDSTNFMLDQVKIIHSDAVLKKAVQGLKYDQFNPQIEIQDDKEEQWIVQKIYADISSKVQEILGGITPSLESSSKENRIQMAIRAFRGRSKVEALPFSSHVLLTVYGTNREALNEEIDVWIKSYRSVLRKLTLQDHSTFLMSRIKHWDEKANNAKVTLDKYIDEHPDANDPMLELTRNQRLEQQAFLRWLQHQNERNQEGFPNYKNYNFPNPRDIQIPITAPPQEYVLSTLEAKEKELEVAKVELLGKYPERSKTVLDHMIKIKEVQKEIANIKSSSSTVSTVNDVTTADENNDLEFATRKFIEKLKRESQIEMEIKERKILRDNYDNALQEKQNYSQKSDLTLEISEARQMIQVTKLNPPMTEESEANRLRKMKIFIGTFAGFSIGVLLSISFELLSRKIRFKLDVEEELGLKVVGVLPEN